MAIAISFSVSFLGLIALFFFKDWEEKRQPAFYRKKRAYLDAYVLRVSQSFLELFPRIQNAFSALFHTVVFYASHLVLYLIRFIERKLVKFVNMIKGRRDISRNRGSASLFLNAISEKEKDVGAREKRGL